MRRLLPWHNSSRFGTCSWNLSVSLVFAILLGVYWSVRFLHADRSHDDGLLFPLWADRKEHVNSWKRLIGHPENITTPPEHRFSFLSIKQLWANIFICQNVFNTLLWNVTTRHSRIIENGLKGRTSALFILVFFSSISQFGLFAFVLTRVNSCLLLFVYQCPYR